MVIYTLFVNWNSHGYKSQISHSTITGLKGTPSVCKLWWTGLSVKTNAENEKKAPKGNLKINNYNFHTVDGLV